MKKTYPIPPDMKGRVYVYPRREGFCLWCGLDLKLTNDRRRTSFCKTEHSILYNNHFDWQQGIKSFIMNRDNFSCVKCNFNENDFKKLLDKKFPRSSDISTYHYFDFKRLDKQRKYAKAEGYDFTKSILEIDHIKPIAMGGSPFDHSNLQTLCQKCHKSKTKIDIGNIAKINAICREVREYWKQKDRKTYLLGFFNGS